MATEFMVKILDDVKRWDEPLGEIVPMNYGEIFMRKDWVWVLQTISDKLPLTPIVIPTNGYALIEKNVDLLCSVETFKVINFSVNAYFDETYEKFTGLPAKNMQRIEEACKRIKVLRSDVVIRLSMVSDPMYQTDIEKDAFKKFWGQFGEVWIIPAASSNRPDKKPIIHTSIPCRSIFSDIVVGYDGKLTSCCFDPSMIIDCGEYSGDLRRDWRNPKLEELRMVHNEHNRQTIKWCKGCSFA